MRHLTQSEIESWVENANVSRAAREHVAICGQCQQHVAQAQRIEAALFSIARAEPASDLSARIIAQLPRAASHPMSHRNPWLGTAMLIAALIGLLLAYQTVLDLSTNGAFELVSYYTAQPEIVTMYPNEAIGTLSAAVPWATVAGVLVVMALALLLMIRWTSDASTQVAPSASRHA
ncbi:MAG TPA: hypothetical protein VFD70_22735 [Anaerolineae bacterium]|nr:hypothetical protein [Anaerolineae bacterium]